MAQGTFVTAINCMDGRVQEPVLHWMKQRFGVDYVDMITEAGPDKLMTAGPIQTVESIKDRVNVSVNRHHSRVVALVGHHDCAAYPATKEEHVDSIRRCIHIIESWSLPVRVLGLWVDDEWRVELVHDTNDRVAASPPPNGTVP